MIMERYDKATIGKAALSAFRILMGWYCLWSFLDKMFGLGFETPSGSGYAQGGSPSSFVVYVTDGLFSDLFDSLAGNEFIDIVLLASLLVLGISLILGITSKLGTFGMVAFLLVMYTLQVPPIDNPIIDDHIIMAAGMIAVYFLGGFDILSLGPRWKELPFVKRFPILE